METTPKSLSTLYSIVFVGARGPTYEEQSDDVINLLAQIPSLKLTYTLKIDPWKRRFLLETTIFRGHVSFRECIAPTSAILSLVENCHKTLCKATSTCTEKSTPTDMWCFFCTSGLHRSIQLQKTLQYKFYLHNKNLQKRYSFTYEQCTFCIFLLHEPDVPLLVPDVPWNTGWFMTESWNIDQYNPHGTNG